MTSGHLPRSGVLKILGGWLLLSSQYETWAMGQSCFKSQLQFWLLSCEYGPKGSLITYQVEAPQGGPEAGIFEKQFRECGY